MTSDRSRSLKITAGRLARMSDGSCIGKSGETHVLATVVSRTTSSASGMTPLTVDYRQKAAAAGRIPTNYLRREIGSSEREILTSRVVDRSLRPLFKPGYLYETQIICNLMSVDGVNDPEVVAINAASAALAVSDIPWNSPVGAVRIGLDDKNDVIVNPTRRELNSCRLDMVVSGTEGKEIVMIEASTKESIGLNWLTKAIAKATKEISTICKGIKKLKESVHRKERVVEKFFIPSEEELQLIRSNFSQEVKEVFMNGNHDKASRDKELQAIRAKVLEVQAVNFPTESSIVHDYAWVSLMRECYRNVVMETGLRADGRKVDEVRPLSCDINLFPSLHGSAIFQRGQTQVLCSVALDSLNSVLRSDPISAITSGIKEKNFMLHYEFPPFATNETGRASSFGRRELGHGALAEKSLRPLIPDKFPFTIRLSCDVLESNGSSSMASVCAGSLALMDAGVPIETHGAGVAMGLLKKDGDYTFLTDISGIEDFLGEMDFKVAGTKTGFTALQLDVKGPGGIPAKVVMDSLIRGNDAKGKMIRFMNEKISVHRSEKKSEWPVIVNVEVPTHKRSKFLGCGGMNLKKLTAETGVQITQDIGEVNTFNVFAPNQEVMDEAQGAIAELLQDEPGAPTIDFGSIVNSKILEIKDNGIVLSLHPKIEPVFMHNKELDQRKIQHPSVLNLNIGDEIQVKYFGRDPVSGQIRVSRRILQITTPKLVRQPGEKRVDEKLAGEV